MTILIKRVSFDEAHFGRMATSTVNRRIWSELHKETSSHPENRSFALRWNSSQRFRPGRRSAEPHLSSNGTSDVCGAVPTV
ncbi:hypothetical protein TNCV_4883751 [Trichonephila clavipes]|nr:hypothetical protein TNCV_4883751 [Trichonephila clavipes]